jgi:FkbM family methyltransferase
VRAVRVPVQSLDAHVERTAVGRVDLIKMDIEGGEWDALLGAARLFARDRPVLQCEIEPVRIEPWAYDPGEILKLVRS